MGLELATERTAAENWNFGNNFALETGAESYLLFQDPLKAFFVLISQNRTCLHYSNFLLERTEQ